MSRIRWYHFYFVLALFDVAVILSSLLLHDRTLEAAGRMKDNAIQLDDESRKLQRLQEAILSLNKPGNDLFQSDSNVDDEWRRFGRAQNRLDAALIDAR